MTLIPKAPESVSETLLFQQLVATSTPADGLAERASVVIQHVTPILDAIATGPFHEFTLHNRDHAKKLVHLGAYVVSPETLQLLSALELGSIITASYLHDLGMSLSTTERTRILIDPAFTESLESWPQLAEDLEQARKQAELAEGPRKLALERRVFQLQEAALAHYLRPRHAEPARYQGLFTRLKESTGRGDLFEVEGVSFEKELIDICASHNRDPSVLLGVRDPYSDDFPRDLVVGGQRLNVQFCAAVLRLVDILDFDRERTPRILFESLGIEQSDLPGHEVTLREWSKHMAVHAIELTPHEVVASADSSHPAIERALRDFCLIIEREIRDTLAIIRRNPPGILAAYQIELPVSVRAQVRPQGYVYRDLAFRLDEAAVARLLMGEALYPQPLMALRELLQNAIDACRTRDLIEPRPASGPRVHLTAHTDNAGRVWLEVADSGFGMDEHILSEYFFTVGRSFYGSPEFDNLVRSSGRSFSPISRFGIGILSVFMIADLIEVETRCVHSPRGDTASRRVRIEGRFGLAFITRNEEPQEGTRIRIRLKARQTVAIDHVLAAALAYIKRTFIRPQVAIGVNLADQHLTLGPGRFIRLLPDALRELIERQVEPVVIELDRWSEYLSGRVILFFAREKDGSLALRYRGKKAPIRSEDYKRYIEDFSGNRITVNGITMSLKKIGRVIGRKGSGSLRAAGALDIEVRGSKEVEYNVTRDRLVVSSGLNVRQELRRAIYRCLVETGLASRLDGESLSLWHPAAESGQPSSRRTFLVRDEGLLKAVQKLLPSEPWPIGLHQTIADTLGIKPALSYAAIDTLLTTKRHVREA